MVLRHRVFVNLNSLLAPKTYKVLITMNINNLSFTLTQHHPENYEFDVKLLSLNKWADFKWIYIFLGNKFVNSIQNNQQKVFHKAICWINCWFHLFLIWSFKPCIWLSCRLLFLPFVPCFQSINSAHDVLDWKERF